MAAFAVRARREGIFYLYLAPFALLIGLFGLWPIAQSVKIAFTDSYTALSPNPVWVGLDNFAALLEDPFFLRSLTSTLFYTAAAVVVNLSFALAAAMLLEAKALGRSRALFQLALFLPVVTPDVAGYIVWKWMYDGSFGAINAFIGLFGFAPHGWISTPGSAIWAILAAELWHHAGFYAIVFATNLKLLDPALDEAAKLDGAGPFARFWHVTLPQLRPALTINAVYATIQFLKTFTVVVVMTKGGPGFSTNFLSYYAYRKFDEGLYGVATAMATTLFLIVIVLALGLYRYGDRVKGG